MKRNLFKLVVAIIIIGLIFISYSFKSFSASIKLNLDKSSYFIGDTFTLTISGINGRIKIIPNSNLVLNIFDDQWVDGKLTVTGVAQKSGIGVITVIPVDVSTDGPEPEEVTEQMSINIEIKEKEPINSFDNYNDENNIEYKEEQGTISEFGLTDLYLYGIDENSKMIELEFSPKFDINIDTYKCQVQENIKKVEIIYEANEYKEFVEVIGDEKELVYGENPIEIIIKDNVNNEKKYKILVIKNQTKVDETVQENDYKNDEIKNEIENQQETIKPSIKTKIVGLIIIMLVFCCIGIYVYINKYKKK